MKNLMLLKYSDNGKKRTDPGHRDEMLVASTGSVSESFIVDHYEKLGINNNKYERYRKVREFLWGERKENMTEEELKNLNIATIDYVQLSAIINANIFFPDCENYITALTSDSFIENTKGSKGRDYLFEFYTAARFKAAGCNIEIKEPDFLAKFEDIQFSIAVKRFKPKRLEIRIKEALRQIEKSKTPGIIVINITINDLYPKFAYTKTTVEVDLKKIIEWLDINFVKIIERNYMRWGITHEKVSHICAFYIGMSSLENKLSTISHFTFQRIKRHTPTTQSDLIFYEKIERVMTNLRLTLPEMQ